MAASTTARVSLRAAALLLLLLVAFYVGRPLYWKLSATIHDIRHNKQTVKQGLSLSLSKKNLLFLLLVSDLLLLLFVSGLGISQFVLDARRSVGWIHDESDSGLGDDSSVQKLGTAAHRRILRVLDPDRNGWPR